MEVRKEVLVTFAWVTRPERPKGAKDEVKRPEGPPTRSQGPEGPLTSSIGNIFYLFSPIGNIIQPFGPSELRDTWRASAQVVTSHQW